MITKISLFAICLEAIIYLLLYNFHDCTFQDEKYYCEVAIAQYFSC